MQFFKLAFAAGIIGSAVAAPAPRDVAVVSVALSAVSSVKSTVDAELSGIESAVNSAVNGEVVPLVNASLTNVLAEVEGLVNTIVPLVTGTVLPLVESEVNNVPALLTEVKGLVSNVNSTVVTLVGGVASGMFTIPRRSNIYIYIYTNKSFQMSSLRSSLRSLPSSTSSSPS
jgi:hypothetical protein